MTSREFCYRLQGYFEITKETNGLSQAQSEVIQKHLSLVFIHEIDNSYGNKEHTSKLNEAHAKSAKHMLKDEYAIHDEIDDKINKQTPRPRC